MHLITMAHLGEAQGVIELFKLSRITPSLFEGENVTCLITGEGPFEAATRTASQLGQKKYQKVINLGIAGALNHDLPLESIYPIRSIYLAIDGKPQFKSFKSLESGLDCITSFERILDAQKALPLSGVGQLVDREAWGVAMAAKEAQVRFESYKLISDKAGTLGACEIVKEKAQEWSKELALYLKNLLSVSEVQETSFKLEGFYFTFTTENQFKQLLKKISLRDDQSPESILRALPTNEIINEVALAKDRTKLLIKCMEEKLDPMKKSLESGLKDWKRRFESNGITLQTDQTWESEEVKVSFTVATQRELLEKLATLNKLELAPFYKLRDGSSYVE
jgi:hypothetical protein